MIPKIIWQTHEYKYEELPRHFQQISLSWQNLNPGWEYQYFDRKARDEYVKTYGGELFDVYKKVRGPYRADIWRYLVLYLEGGVYADMDSFCTTPMDYILKDVTDNIDMVTTGLDQSGNTNNANFAAKKGSIILYECIDKIKKDFKQNQGRGQIWQSFSDGVAQNNEIVLNTMQALHSSTFKKDFKEENIEIDYYGTKYLYSDLMHKLNLL